MIPRALEILRQSPAHARRPPRSRTAAWVSGRRSLRMLHRLGSAEAEKSLFIARGDDAIRNPAEQLVVAVNKRDAQAVQALTLP